MEASANSGLGMGTEKDPYKLRFRHLNGDIGPLEFDETSTVGSMKGAVFDRWPENGTLAELVRSCRQTVNNTYAPCIPHAHN